MVTAAAVSFSTLPAMAGDGDVEHEGSCNRRSGWKLKLGPKAAD
jgi:hypothetical protein